ncbi:MAG TPA: phospho-N-acetylmuramoyl-pentapeptide-transferase [Limnochordia bacterium]|nr:phospho-N-acetylmuramoyl-pentapeptide-transferase [Bacillota bacterium]HOB07840.1 phospho-N-acetylmuramoyl-pentapeptide-transferase [Limnochordia bacterium]NLH31133.1 phospho-N-acetylmuramoyl-pentapeptide-transferase [Bacillota bacterium]HPT93251.1 phospho-N-acetylmuramoyl-pentapeptide-transferase [Limnochordia bacterium]HPZ30007.1 phospho-N-acetylmuramoyl-pentapeptide-transferase [Limnochordia bacterium]
MYSPLFGALTAFVVVVLIGPGIIRYLTKLKFGQNVRVDGPRRHLQKAGTPTMGGIMILIGLVFAALVLGKNSSHLLFALFITAAYGAIGFLDDLLIIVTRSSLGLKARQKLFGQIFIAVLVALYALSRDDIGTAVLIPFTETTIELPVVVYVLLTLGVMLGTTNAVNLTDGLDGLAAGAVAIAAASYGVIGYLLDSVDLAVFAGSLVGACLGFVWFNSHPAAVFMGDTGALALGAALGITAILTRTPFHLAIVGGLFVIETLSDIIQVVYFRLTKGKRFFKMAPLHHHFELSGWEEPKIVARFWLIGLFFALLGLLAVL